MSGADCVRVHLYIRQTPTFVDVARQYWQTGFRRFASPRAASILSIAWWLVAQAHRVCKKYSLLVIAGHKARSAVFQAK